MRRAMPSYGALSMQPVQRIFILALAFVVTLGAALGAFLFVTVWPYFSLIGKVAAAVVIDGLGCTAALMLAFTYNKIVSWTIRRRLVVFGEIGAYRERDGTWIHLSGIHQQMGLPPQQLMIEAVKPEPVADKATVLELHNMGLTLRDICARTGVSYHYVQKWTSEK